MLRFRLALCNEVLRELDFAQQCALAASLGYDGLEVAPFTLSDTPHLLSSARLTELRRIAADAGIVISGLHWLLIKPAGLSLTDPDATVRLRSIDVMRRLVALCAELGGEYLVHGSPAQRRLPDCGAADARAWAMEACWMAADAATTAGLRYCLEPLSRNETNFINTIAEAADIIETIDRPGLCTMLDASAATRTEAGSPATLVTRWLPSGLIGHVHLNDTSRQGPGQGDTPIAPILRALAAGAYTHWIGIEPFDYIPDGPTSAARAIGYVRGIEAAL
ncbi:MAG TPA: sugar phosphate isomerase/epimerase family protein [Acetobacteraceae bacterium]|jgi:D-psicose/D-tagatose/L-ribulose 3-epimerase|nr:sugar phosphate isomerase/epimerase family protein [Acetobacteraceae bacterium]